MLQGSVRKGRNTTSENTSEQHNANSHENKPKRVKVPPCGPPFRFSGMTCHRWSAAGVKVTSLHFLHPLTSDNCLEFYFQDLPPETSGPPHPLSGVSHHVVAKLPSWEKEKSEPL